MKWTEKTCSVFFFPLCANQILLKCFSKFLQVIVLAQTLSALYSTGQLLVTLSHWWELPNDQPLSSKIRLMCSLVTSILLYACEAWTLTAELQRRIQAMEMRCYRKILRISYKDSATNEEIRAKIQQAIGPHEDLLTMVKRRKLQWYDHVPCSSGLAKTIFQSQWKGKKTRQTEEEVGRQHQGLDRPRVRQVPEGSGEQENWRKLVAKSSVVPQRPSRLRDRWWWWDELYHWHIYDW